MRSRLVLKLGCVILLKVAFAPLITNISVSSLLFYELAIL